MQMNMSAYLACAFSFLALVAVALLSRVLL